MTITCRNWTEKELKKVFVGEDSNLTTIFMNGKTFQKNEVKFYPYHLRKTYHIYFENDSPVVVYAVDDNSLRWFLEQEYHIDQIVYAEEIITSSRMVDL